VRIDPCPILPEGVRARRLARLRGQEPEGVHRSARASMAKHVPGHGIEFPGWWRRGLRLSATRFREEAESEATNRPSSSRALCRRTSARCSVRAKGPFRWAARCRATAGHLQDDKAIHRLFPGTNEPFQKWIRVTWAAEGRFPGSSRPAICCWCTAFFERDVAGLKFNEMVASGRAGKRPIVIGRDHLDAGSVGLALP